jgi:hypothetical protein
VAIEGIGVDAPLIPREQFKGPLSAVQVNTGFDPGAALSVPLRDRSIHADQIAGAIREKPHAWTDRTPNRESELSRPEVVDKRVLQHTACVHARVHGRTPDTELPHGSEGDDVPRDGVRVGSIAQMP